MKIFYSWQTDAPRKTNKEFIHGAVQEAIEKLGDSLELSEAQRNSIELDQDTQGVLGSPEIAKVIFEKIAASNVVVTDVSLVANGKNNKAHINSNVAIELGYAYGKIGDEAILKVMNTHYGGPESLPFDLRIRRHPVQYNLAPDADKRTVAKERTRLSKQIEGILKLYLDGYSPAKGAAHTEVPYVKQRGRFWEHSEPLIPSDGHSAGDFYWPGARLLYFRCIPERQLQTLTPRQTGDLAVNLRPLLTKQGFSVTRNKWGSISHDLNRHGGVLYGASQLFRNGEIWSVDAYYSERTNRPNDYVEFDDDEEIKQIIPTSAVQRDYPQAINSVRKLAQELGYGESYTVEIGLSGAKDVYLAVRDVYDPFLGPFYGDEVYFRKSISSDYPTEKLMSDFWEALFSEVGCDVPDELLYREA